MGLAEDRSLIHGVTYASQLAPSEPPLILVEAKEKSGKSSAAITLFDWPNDGDRPLVAAFDKTGPDACASLGFAVPNVKIGDLPGVNMWEKSNAFLSNLEDVYINKRKKPYSSIVVDCASTQASEYWRMSAGLTNPLQRYGIVLDYCTEFLDRIRELGVPVVYLAWLEAPWLEETGSGANKKKIQHKGGPLIRGSFKHVLGGKATMILYLEKQKPAPADKEKDSDGFKRVFHTTEYGNVECGGRYRLPEPIPANLGYALALITGQIENPALAGIEMKR